MSNPLLIKNGFLDTNNPNFPSVNEPFGAGRNAFRLFYDFGIMLSCFRSDAANKQVLDVACGTGWITEWLARMGYSVSALDLDKGAESIIQVRMCADLRIDPENFNFLSGDAHHLPYSANEFGHVVCFDSLHHMQEYSSVFTEIYRVLEPGGRAIFIEPGAQHSKSQETIDFIKKFKKDDPDWIEKDVVLQEVVTLAQEIGYSRFRIRPTIWPNLIDWSIQEWGAFSASDGPIRTAFCDIYADFFENRRLCFYLEKGEQI